LSDLGAAHASLLTDAHIAVALCLESNAGEHEHVISGYSLLKGIGDGEPIASDRFAVGGHEWVLLFYPDGKRSTSDPNAPSPADDPYAALFVALIGEGPRPQGVVTARSTGSRWWTSRTAGGTSRRGGSATRAR
jgi:hypothetical protein